jgi:hypothetical protein
MTIVLQVGVGGTGITQGATNQTLPTPHSVLDHILRSTRANAPASGSDAHTSAAAHLVMLAIVPLLQISTTASWV